MKPMHKVPFITVEDEEPDMIVSFALGLDAESSLTLLRTPIFEEILEESERGVSVGTGPSADEDRELLVSVHWLEGQAVIVSSHREFRLDLATVDPEEVTEAKAMLKRMNFDSRFVIHAAFQETHPK
jgi:hypothetical protein